jgi:hypothetical protein
MVEWKISKTCSAVLASKLPVGSSATSKGGSLAKARAMAARGCYPPDTMPGNFPAWLASPTISRRCSARSRLALGVSTPRNSIGSTTFYRSQA